MSRQIESLLKTMEDNVVKLCEKTYTMTRPQINLFLGIQGLQNSENHVIPCLPAGSLEDYLPKIIQSLWGASTIIEAIRSVYELLEQRELVTCCNPKHIYAPLRLHMCKSMDHDVVRELEKTR